MGCQLQGKAKLSAVTWSLRCVASCNLRYSRVSSLVGIIEMEVQTWLSLPITHTNEAGTSLCVCVCLHNSFVSVEAREVPPDAAVTHTAETERGRDSEKLIGVNGRWN